MMPFPPVIHYLDFEVLSEPWIKYRLSDGTTLLLRTIVTNILKTGQYDPFGKPLYGTISTTLQVIHAPKDLRGIPTNPPPTPEQLADSVVAEVNSTPDREDWNSYRCEDGSSLQLKCVVMSVKRTSKYDQFGEPVYIVSTQNMMKDDIPKTLWKKSQPQ